MFSYVPNAVQLAPDSPPSEVDTSHFWATPGRRRDMGDFLHSAEFFRTSQRQHPNRQDMFESVQVVPNSQGSYSVIPSRSQLNWYHPRGHDYFGGQGHDFEGNWGKVGGYRNTASAPPNLQHFVAGPGNRRNLRMKKDDSSQGSGREGPDRTEGPSSRTLSRTIRPNRPPKPPTLEGLEEQEEFPDRQGTAPKLPGAQEQQQQQQQLPPRGASKQMSRAFTVYREHNEMVSRARPAPQPRKEASSFPRNISNPELRQKQGKAGQSDKGQKGFSQSARVVSPARDIGSKKYNETLHASLTRATETMEEEFQCSCKGYHSHPLNLCPSINAEILSQMTHQRNLIASMQEGRADFGSHDDPRNIFWTPSLSFNPYRHGDPLVSFESLWPSEKDLLQHLQNSGIQMTVLRGAVLDLCKMAVTCGPAHLLKCLIELSLVRVDQALDDGGGMLHLACLARNKSAVSYLVSAGINHKLKDKNGHTAGQVCLCPSVRRQLPPRYLLQPSHKDSKMVLKPCLQDKDTIFGLAKNPKYFSEIQKKLQTFDFNVNTECDNKGDFLLHIACRGGLVQLPLLMALVKIQGADVELCNAEGMTPLMLAAAAGNYVLCDVLMCLFGADPNKPNPNSGRCALHYAAEGNHRKTVECLIRRGADVNIEDHDGRRPDDTPLGVWSQEDCKEVIEFNRTKRMEMLCEKVRKGNLEDTPLLPSDLCIVDGEGCTLLMTAAIYNKEDTIFCLLDVNDKTINAQHAKTGMTALAIAAQMGNLDAVRVLLERGANPGIPDMENYLALHHAVLHNQESVVDSLLDHFPQAYLGLNKALRICKRNSIHLKLKSAWDRRQKDIVTPKLMECAISGNADDLFRLLDEGDLLNPKSASGSWPLYLAVESGHIDVVRLLFEKGGDVRKRHMTTGYTVLHVAARMNHLEIVSFLLSHCHTRARPSPSPSPQYAHHVPARRILDINALDKEKRTALQIAAEKGYMRIVTLLLQSGASTAVLDKNGSLFTCAEYEGVRMQVEVERERHTKTVMKLLEEKSKKALKVLQGVWLPKLDHNLRNKSGRTPLMVACSKGWLPVVKFLLDSAVYPDEDEYESEDISDTDSGVLDPSTYHKMTAFPDEDASGRFTLSTDCQVDGMTTPASPSDRDMVGGTEDLPHQAGRADPQTLHALLQQVGRPKGLSIFHDNRVSHVCAVGTGDERTALHCALEGGDCPLVVAALLEADYACLNMQDQSGMSPLHLACQLGRKKSIDVLLLQEGIDLNLRTREGLLPEEMTASKSIVRTVQKARQNQLGVLVPETPTPTPSEASKPPSTAATSINFEKVQRQYEDLKKDLMS